MLREDEKAKNGGDNEQFSLGDLEHNPAGDCLRHWVGHASELLPIKMEGLGHLLTDPCPPFISWACPQGC